MPQAVGFFDNLSINVVAPFSAVATTIKLDAAHPVYADLQAWATDTMTTGAGRLAALTVTDGTDVEVLTISGYSAASDVFTVNRINEIDWTGRANVRAEMRVTAYEMQSIVNRIVNLETAVFGPGYGGA